MNIKTIKPYFLPTLLFLSALALRLALISKGAFHVDCLNLAIQSQHTLKTRTLQGLFGFGYPLTVLLGALFVRLTEIFTAPDPVKAVNLMSVVFSSACVPLLFILGQKIFDRTTGLLSAITLTFTPIFFGISVFGKSHAPSLFFLLMGIYFLYKFSESAGKKHLWLAGLAIGCMGAIRLQDMLLIVPALTVLCLTGYRPRVKNKAYPLRPKQPVIQNCIALWFVVVLITTLFHLPYVMQNAQGSHYAPQLSTFFKQGVTDNYQGIFSTAFVVSLIFLMKTFTEVGLFISFAGLAMMAWKHHKTFLFFIIWIIPALLFYGNLQTSVPRFLTLILPPLILSQGYFFTRLMARNKIFRAVFLIIYSLTLFLSFTSIYPILSFRHKHALLPDYARWVGQKIERNARVITVDEHLFFEYYGNIHTLSRPSHFSSLDDTTLLSFQNTLDKLLKEGIPVYITSIALYSYNPEKKFSTLIKNNYTLTYTGTGLYEDWHRGILKQKIIRNTLIRITPRSSPLQPVFSN